MNLNIKNGSVYGYMYSLWLYCVGQTDKNKPFYKSDDLICRVTYYPTNSFAFPICDSDGVFYDFVSSYDECGGTIFIQEVNDQNSSFFDVSWRTDDEKKDIKRIVINDGYKEAIKKAIRSVVNNSPFRKVYLQIRCQCHEKDNIIGMLTVSQVEELIDKDKLFGNIVYVIYDPEN